MKKILSFTLFFWIGLTHAQVGVNTATPHASSMLDIAATNKGVLVPRVSLPNVNVTMLDGTNTAATGLLIWNTNNATVGGNGSGFYFFNGAVWVPLTQTATTDADFLEVGASTPPDDVNDVKYTLGRTMFGDNTAPSGKVQIKSDDIYTNLVLTNTATGTPTALSAAVSGTATSKSVLSLSMSGSTTGVGGINRFITTNDVSNSGSVNNVSIYQQFGGTGTGYTGLRNWFTASSNYTAPLKGTENLMMSNTASDQYGTYTTLYGSGNGSKYGEYISADPTAGGTHYGIYANVTKSGSYAGYFLGAVGIGSTFADVYKLPSGRGTNGQIMQTDAAGNVSWVSPTAGSDDQNLLTPILTGTTLNLGIESGTGTSIDLAALQDGTGTDDQNLLTPSLTGTTLNLGIEGGTGTSVNLSALRDHDWYEVGGTSPADDIADQIYTDGDVSIGKNTAAVGKTDISNLDKARTLYLETTGTLSGSRHGIFNTVDAGLTNSFSSGITNLVTGLATWKYGIRNTFNTVATGLNELGTENVFNSSGNLTRWGYSNYVYPSNSCDGVFYGFRNNVGPNQIGPVVGLANTLNAGSANTVTGVANNISGSGNAIVTGVNTSIDNGGSNTKYGEKIYINPASGGTHYGVYSEVTKPNSYAGYFLGQLSVGTTFGNNYVLPASRGLNGQIMQTNSTGMVSWVTPSTVFTDTDDQNLLTPTLTGTTLNLGIQNGTGTSIDLSALTNVNANNGLNIDAGVVQLGGALTEDTTIAFGTNTMRYNLNGLGDLIVQDNGVGKFSFNDDGTTFAGGDMYWKQANTTGANVARMYASADDGVLDLYQGGTVANRLYANGNSFFNGGNVAFGKTLPNYLVDVFDNASTTNRALNIYRSDNLTTDSYAAAFTKVSSGTGRSHALYTDVSGTGTGQKYGIFNELNSAAAGNQYGVRNWIRSATPDQIIGVFNNIENSGTGNQYGLYNGMRGAASAQTRAIHNEFDTPVSTSELTGMLNQITDGTPGTGGFNGVFNNFGNPNNGNFYGSRTEFTGAATGTGTKFGTYNLLSSGAGGAHYGTYNNVSVAKGWAGYFVGRNYISDRLSVGLTDNPDAAISVYKNSTGTYAHLNLTETSVNDGARIRFENANETANNWILYGRADNTATDNVFNLYSTVGGNVLQATGDGRVGISRFPATNDLEVNGTASKTVAGAWLANSDRRLKKDIETIAPDEALQKILALRGVTYTWNDDKTGIIRPTSTQMGFIAQEIETVFPDKVSTDRLGYLQTAYGDYDPVVFQAIKALHNRIELLEQENDALKKMLEKILALEQRLNASAAANQPQP